MGVFTHGDNVREMELMNAYGMKPLDVPRSATSVPSKIFDMKQLGEIKSGYLADLIAVEGNPTETMSALRKVTMVMKNGQWYKKP